MGGGFQGSQLPTNIMIPGTWSFKCKKKHDWKIRKFKARYYVIRDIQKRLSPKPLNSYYLVVQWATVRLMLILQCILGFQSQSIDFTNSCAQADIPNGEPFFIEIVRNFKSYRVKCDVFLRLKKILHGKSEAAHLWYEKL